jgi:hypothetical protein
MVVLSRLSSWALLALLNFNIDIKYTNKKEIKYLYVRFEGKAENFIIFGTLASDFCAQQKQISAKIQNLES